MWKKSSGGSQYFGLALSFGVVMIVSIVVMYLVGDWIDGKLGTSGIFTLVFVLMGIVSGFRVLMSDLQSIERRNRYREEDGDDDDV